MDVVEKKLEETEFAASAQDIPEDILEFIYRSNPDAEIYQFIIKAFFSNFSGHINKLPEEVEGKAKETEVSKTQTPKDRYISELQASLLEKDVTLNNLYSSNGWRLLLLYYRIRDRLLPANSTRRKLVKFIWNLPKHVGNVKSFMKKRIQE